ncbi:MAG: 3-dehydroquinate dehydratase [Candidatus Entotheonella factor]|uniref:3-dehydroquinate dehydratase n=1 Tax=Entotheonella factor TaxID=1429438 RepID=W4L9V1_ENTF1|nr:MAG: 3-dehydroquinate dehydratase [Candidatus Entotheonella factor]
MGHILVVHGPNLNLLGTREPGIYGAATLPEINQQLQRQAEEAGHTLSHFQSNHEGAIVDYIQQQGREADILIINPGAFTHTSVAIRDAILAVALPAIEVHLSNIHQREPFRHHSYFSDICIGQVVGLGPQGYSLALQAACTRLNAE